MKTKDYSLQNEPLNQQRRPQLAQDDAWIVDFLGRTTVGHIATRWDDQPFITPSTFWYEPGSHQIYFHSNVVGRVRANAERHPQVCFEASEFGQLLPSNLAVEFSIQYASVVVFGEIEILQDDEAKRQALYGLIRKYFPDKRPGIEYRPITDHELKRTAVYAIKIASWSGKRNWPEQAIQSPNWPEGK